MEIRCYFDVVEMLLFVKVCGESLIGSGVEDIVEVREGDRAFMAMSV